MTQETPKPKNNIAVILMLGAISLGNLGGLYYLYQQHLDDQTKLQSMIASHASMATDFQSQINHDIAEMKSTQEQMRLQTHDNTLDQIEWLLTQAQVQINVFKQIRYGKAYLRQAKKIALAKDLHGLADTIHLDLIALKQSGITPLHQVLSQIAELKEKLDNLTPLPHKAMTPEPQSDISPNLASAITLLKPFIKIEHYHETPPKFLTADDQRIVIQNLELLLAEIQYAAISSQPLLFQKLTLLFKQELQVLDAKSNLSPLIDTLANSQLEMKQAIHLQSLNMVQQLLQTKSVS